MRKEDNSTFAGTLMKWFSYYTSICVFLSIAIRSLDFELPSAVAAAVSVYESAREVIFTFLPLADVFIFLAAAINIDLELKAPWQDVVVILFIYTMIQVHDARKGALNHHYAQAWRFFAGMIGTIAAVILLSRTADDTPIVLAIAGGVSLGILIFRALHPFQIAFDVGWKSLIQSGKPEPTTIWTYLIFIVELIQNKTAISMFIKKLLSAIKLCIWLLAIFLVYSIYRIVLPSLVGPESEFFFLILFMITIALFQVFMESKPLPFEGKQIQIPIPFKQGRRLYFSRNSGNYAIAKDIGLTMLCVFVLAYSGIAQKHISSFAVNEEVESE